MLYQVKMSLMYCRANFSSIFRHLSLAQRLKHNDIFVIFPNVALLWPPKQKYFIEIHILFL